ncbi:MAG: hypothetical protein LBU32_29505 [Clostridiales bacterium]|nr:hypothetical protein [Clostridiales bacterium]
MQCREDDSLPGAGGGKSPLARLHAERGDVYSIASLTLEFLIQIQDRCACGKLT